jgi:hypothetical protein
MLKIKILFLIIGNFTLQAIIAQNNTLHFDGNNDFVTLPINQNLTTNQTSIFTIEFWTNYEQLNNPNYAHLFAINTSNGLNRFGIRATNSINNSDGIVILGVNSSGFRYLNGNITVGDGNCHLISVVSNGSSISLFIDGVLDGSMNMTVSVLSSDLYSLDQEYDNGLIPSQFFNGNINEIRIWNNSRTQTEIQTNMNTVLLGNEPGLVAYYDCNQGTPGGNNTSEINLNNSSSVTGLNGTFNNFTLTGTTSNFIQSTCYTCITTYDSTNITECDQYIWNDSTYTISGIYTDSLIDINGCDSITTLNLTINNSESSIDSITSTNNYTWVNDTTYYYSTNLPTYTYTNLLGCDSIVTLNLTITDSVINSNNVLNFNATNQDYITLNNLSTELTGLTSFTIEFLTKYNQYDNLNYGTLFAINTNNGLNRFIIFTSGSNSNYTDGAVNIVATNGNMNNQYIYGDELVGDENCHLISAIYNNGSISLYVDGILDGSMYHPLQLNSNDLVSLGQEYDNGLATSEFYTGNLDNIRIWNTVKTQAEIQTNMNIELNGNEPGLVAYYDCNQGTPGGNNTSEVNLYNSSSVTGLNGTFNNFTLTGPTSNFIFNECKRPIDSLNSIYEIEATTTELKEIIIYPNPSSNQISFKLNTLKPKNISIYDLNGKTITVNAVQSQNNIITVDIKNLKSGIYILYIIDTTGSIKRTKFTKI